MKNIISLAIIILFVNTKVISQVKITGTIIDSLSKKSIELASISVQHKNNGIYSDSIGKFQLDGLYEFDTVVIRHIAYKTLHILANEIKQNKLIYLQPQTIPLERVLIKPNKYYEKTIWTLKSPSKSTFMGFSGFELGTFVYSKFRNSIIKEIIIKTKKNKKAGEYYIKLHIYHVNNGKPSDEILLSKNTFILSAKTNEIKINIEDENIMLINSGVFISLEWIGKKENNGFNKKITTNLVPQVIVTDKKSSNKTLYRFWNMDWQDFSKLLYLKNANIILGINLQIQE